MKTQLTVAVVLISVVFLMFGCPNNPIPVGSNSLRLNNYSSCPLSALYISPVSYDSWGANQLYDYVYPGYYYTVIGIPDGYYDLKVVNSDGYYACRWDILFYDGVMINWNIYDAKSLNKSAKDGEINGEIAINVDPVTEYYNSVFVPLELFEASGGQSEFK